MGGLVAWVSPQALTRVRELVPELGIELAAAFIGGLLAGRFVAWRAGRLTAASRNAVALVRAPSV